MCFLILLKNGFVCKKNKAVYFEPNEYGISIMNKAYVSNIDWIPYTQGGRKTPALGDKYFPVLRVIPEATTRNEF